MEPDFVILLPGDVPLELMLVPAGTFLMGSPPEEHNRFADEGPQTNVTITRDFLMGKYPVTQRQWEALMGEGNWPGRAPMDIHGEGDRYPVYFISWYDTQDYLEALNDHILETGQGPLTMRLPTEAEWEYACRGGSSTRFYFGDSLDCDDMEADCAAGELPGNRSDYMWWVGNSNLSAQPVGLKQPNGFNLFDMHGNVMEWCQDWYTESLPGGSVVDPTGPKGGEFRVVRGGSSFDLAVNSRSAFRFFCFKPTLQYGNGGFRVVGHP